MFAPLPVRDADTPAPHHFGLRDGYVLAVGTLEPRKNYVRLLQAFASLRKRLQAAGSRASGGPSIHGGAGDGELKLAIVGREGWLFEPIFLEVARLGLERSVRFFSNATDSDLLALYRHAGAFVFPSLYEGFGIPPLEAMACGIPVAASTGGALPEVLGDAALYFDPLDTQAMSGAIERVLTDGACRLDLRARGFIRASEYTWDRAARAALDLFERVAA